ncbi:MAG: hypothetical protein WBE72_14845 [Terracidiphilus sp.]
MKNGKHEVIAQIAGPGLVLAALVAMVLSNPGIGRAQSKPTQAGHAAAPANSALLAEPLAQEGQSATRGKPDQEGKQEGIKVHGHWTIEVKNPDGKLVTHREFENKLVTGSNAGNLFLSTVLGRTVVTGPWLIALGNSLGSGSPQGGPICPANTQSFNFGDPGECLITEANSTWTLTTTNPGFPSNPPLCPLSSGYCFTSLTLSTQPCSPGLTCGTGTLTLVGTFVAPQAGSITYVDSALYACLVNVTITGNPANCVTQSNYGITSWYQFTSAFLSSPIPVAAGQDVVASVTFSFN